MSTTTTAIKPSIIDRAIGLFSPSAELKRVRARVALSQMERTFEGAALGRRTKNWQATNASANALLSGGLTTLRARARFLGRNNGWAKKAIETIVGSTIGDGITPQARSKARPDLQPVLDDLWLNWAGTLACDWDESLNFYGIQALVMKTVTESGSCLARRRWARKSWGLAVPFQLQVLEPDFLDFSRDRLLENGGRIIQGVEFDKDGKRVAYHLFNEHPGDRLMVWTGFQSNRIPASEVIHVYRLDRAGQVDGIPWGAPNVIKIRDLDEFDDAELVRQKIAACFAAFVHDVEALDENVTSTERHALERVEPGVIEFLPPGKTITFGTPPPSTGGDKFTVHTLRSIAAGYGTTYEAMTGDYSQVNFSSGRMGRLDYRRNVSQWQNHMVVPKLCTGVWQWFLEGAAISSDKVDAPVGSKWTLPRWEMIDPVKETEALKAQVRCGFVSQEEAILQGGRDPDATLGEIATFNAKLDAAKIKLDTDPRKDDGSAPTNDTIHP